MELKDEFPESNESVNEKYFNYTDSKIYIY